MRIVFVSGPCGTMWDLYSAQAYSEILESEGLLTFLPQLQHFLSRDPDKAKANCQKWLEKCDAVLEIGGPGYCYKTFGVAPFRLFYPEEIDPLIRWNKRLASAHGKDPLNWGTEADARDHHVWNAHFHAMAEQAAHGPVTAKKGI